MVRTAAVYSLPAILIAISWLRLEDPQAVGLDGWSVLALALAPALAPTLVLRLALSVPAALTALWIAFDTPAPDDKPGFFVPVAERFADGMNGFFNVAVPFSGIERMKMHGVIILAIFGFCLVLAHAVAARRPLVAVLAVVAGAGWAATLYPSRSILYGAVILAGALWALAGLRSTQPVTAVLAGAALVLVAAVASTSAAVAKDGVLAWERWDPSSSFGGVVSVSYVWDAQYGGIEFSKKERTVLRITGPKRGLYWRATTLDQFDSDRWLDNPIPLSTGLATGRLPNDPLLPTRSLDENTWIKQEVEVGALQDQHVIGAAQPVALDAPDLGGVFHLSGGIVRVYGGLKRGQKYTIYSYAPRPEPADLARVGADVSAWARTVLRHRQDAGRAVRRGRSRRARGGALRRRALRRAVAVPGALEPGQAPACGCEDAVRSRGRDRDVAAEHRRLHLRRVTARARRPAAARPLRDGGQERLLPALRRRDGIDAQVPRHPGARRRRLHERQARWGQLARDRSQRPCLGRGVVPGLRLARIRPDPGARVAHRELQRLVDRIQRRRRGLCIRPAERRGGEGWRERASTVCSRRSGWPSSSARAEPLADDGRPAALWLLLLAGLAAGGAIGAAKVVRRRLRYLTRDPRRLAGAARRELADFLVDQGLEVRAERDTRRATAARAR